MWFLVVVVLACGAIGIVFIIVANQFAMSTGNRLIDIADKLKQAPDALTIKLGSQITLNARFPVVALYALAVIVAVIVPLYVVSKVSVQFLQVDAQVNEPSAVTARSTKIETGLASVDETGALTMRVPMVDETESFVINNDRLVPMTLHVTVDPFRQTVTAELTNTVSQNTLNVDVDWQHHRARIKDPIVLALQDAALASTARAAKNSPSKPAPLSRAFRDVPPLPQQ